MRMGRALGLGMLVVAGGVFVTLLVILWRWNMPSADANELGRVVATRPKVPDADNAYLYLWGFLAPPGEDAARAAEKRVRWLWRKFDHPDDSSADPLENPPTRGQRRSRA